MSTAAGQLYELSNGTLVTLQRQLGAGSFGQVWLVDAVQPGTDSSSFQAALKITTFGTDPKVRDVDLLVEDIFVPELRVLQASIGYDRVVQLIDWYLPDFVAQALAITPPFSLLQMTGVTLVEWHNAAKDTLENLRAMGEKFSGALQYTVSRMVADIRLRGTQRGSDITPLVQWYQNEVRGVLQTAMPPMVLLERADMDLMEWVDGMQRMSANPGVPNTRAQVTQMIQSGPTAIRNTLFNAQRVSSSYGLTGMLSNDYNAIRDIMEGCARSISQFRQATTRALHRLDPSDPFPQAAVHGDLKFENFLVRNGTIKVADFGLETSYNMDISHPSQVPIIYSGTYTFADPATHAARQLARQTRSGCNAGELNPTGPCARLSRPGYKADEYSIGAMLYALGVDSFVIHSTTNEHYQIHRRARTLLDRQATNAPEMLAAIVGLTDPDIDARWTIETFLASPFINPLNVPSSLVAPNDPTTYYTDAVMLQAPRSHFKSSILPPLPISSADLATIVDAPLMSSALYTFMTPLMEREETWDNTVDTSLLVPRASTSNIATRDIFSSPSVPAATAMATMTTTDTTATTNPTMRITRDSSSFGNATSQLQPASQANSAMRITRDSSSFGSTMSQLQPTMRITRDSSSFGSAMSQLQPANQVNSTAMDTSTPTAAPIPVTFTRTRQPSLSTRTNLIR